MRMQATHYSDDIKQVTASQQAFLVGYTIH